MTAPYRKKLIEVALPLKAINDESALRKRKAPAGYPTTLHKWWAQRPLAACRAVLFASLVDDPDSDPEFRLLGEEMTGKKRAELFNLIGELVQWENSNNPEVIRSARAEIARCVASRLVETGKLTRDQVLADGMTLGLFISSCHCRCIAGGFDEKAGRVRYRFETRGLPPPAVVDNFLVEHAPPVLDPFCGGGSIPLEAQRLGLRAYASDLNPVPVLITKALIEIPPKFAGRPPVNPEWQAKHAGEKASQVWQGAQGLAEDVRYYGQWMRDEAEKKIGHLYPKVKITKEMAKNRPDLKEYVGQELTVIAWLWARTVASPSPLYQGIHVPLVRGYWLGKKSGKQAWVEPDIDRQGKSYRFFVCTGTPRAEQKKAIEAGTKLGRGCRFKCLLSDTPIPEDHVKAEGVAGRLGVRLLAIVVEGKKGRVYLSPNDHQEKLASTLTPPADSMEGIDAPIALDKRAIWCLLYGLDRFDKLFTSRQIVMLAALTNLLQEAHDLIAHAAQTETCSSDHRSLHEESNDAQAYADAIAVYLACALARCVDYNSSLASWRPKDNAMRSTFAKQGLPMVWDFAEANPLEKSSAGFADCTRVIAKCVELLPASVAAHVKQLDATAAINGASQPFVCTDPPYYDNIGYADLSDYFYIWLRRAIARIYPSLFSTVLTPKAQELIASPYRHSGDKEEAKKFFEDGLGRAFRQIHDGSSRECPIPVFYAFKQSESDDNGDDDSQDESSTSTTIASTGWETMLEGLIRANFSITGTWPMRTEGDNRQVGQGANALASSIVLVCRPRPANAPLATRKEFMNALRHELPDALKNLQHGNIAPVDLAQASIGPGMAVFTRYSKLIETDGSAMSVRTALGIINQILDEVLAEQEGEFDADTRWALAWFEQFGIDEGAFGDAETLSKAKDTAINGLVEAGIVKARRGKVQLVCRADLPEDWDPAKDKRLTVWETTQYLIRTLETKGELEAAALLNNLGGVAEIARDLAYRLYSICERKKWAEEALAYNGLVIAWPELTKLALSERTRQPSTQQELF